MLTEIRDLDASFRNAIQVSFGTEGSLLWQVTQNVKMLRANLLERVHLLK